VRLSRKERLGDRSIFPLRHTTNVGTLNVQESRKMEPSQAVHPMFSWIITRHRRIEWQPYAKARKF
jgi:hypothetical protein